jgi:hypothetical protein
MSEYQRIVFRAIDGPVSDKNLEYMRRQSSRAEITPWSFENEYHYGDFRGDAVEMLRRGYDFHLHYANFGIRRLLIRLPHGIPDSHRAKRYVEANSLQFIPDKQGRGGSLSIEPYHEAGHLEDLWDLDSLIDRLIPLRAEILDGDLRPLYLAHLAIACDSDHDPEEAHEAPVPAGLERLTDAQRALAELYSLDDSLIAAAADGGPRSPVPTDASSEYAEWLKRQPEATKDMWLAQWLSDPRSSLRREILVEFQNSRNAPLWPTVRRDRTIAALRAIAEEIQDESNRKSAEKAARQKAKRLAQMAADPDRTLRETEKLAAQRSTEAYRQIATLLAELREALVGKEQSALAEQQAQELRSKNPTLRHLIRELRREGLLPK